MKGQPWESFTNQEQWKQYLQHLVKTNTEALYRAIVVIHRLQTEDEKNIKQTTEHNGMGFSSIDAEFLSGLAEKLNNRQHLTPKEKAIARNKMAKYWRQLMIISKERMK